MRNIGFPVIAVLAAMLLVLPGLAAGEQDMPSSATTPSTSPGVTSTVAPGSAAGVRNVNLTSVESSGVSGSATALSGYFGGATPHTRLEVNARMNQMPSANMVYQAWLIDNDSNTRMSLGLFEGMTLHSDMLVSSFTSTGPWDALAVSMEPANDMNPLPGTIVAMGNLPGSVVSSSDFPRVAVLPQDEAFQRQLVMQRYGLTSDQVNDLRFRGLAYSDIYLVSNIAQRCNRSASQAAEIYMASGGDLSTVASTCNTTVASLLEPVPAQAVAGFVGEVRPGTVQPMVVYRMYPNGRPVVTQQLWQEWYRRGYSWQDVAVAANIAAQTGDNVDDLLRMRRIQGMTWRQIAIDRGVNVNDALDVSRWPFSRNGESMGVMPSMEETTTMPPAGTTPPTTAPPPSGPTY